jgi:crossover junction endodeoxyribonuclease RuvC
MTILGIDPGLANCGYAVVLEEKGKLSALTWGCITTSAENEEPERLAAIHRAVEEIIKEHKPDIVACEKLLFNTNVTTAISVGRAQGVVFLAAAGGGLPVCEYAPLEIKQAVAGYGGADKAQVKQMVKRLLGLSEDPKPDHAADALAVCIAYSASRRLKEAAA